MTDLKKFAEDLVNLSVKEVNELATVLKTDYGIEPAATPLVAAAPPSEEGNEKKVEEKTNFDIFIKSAGAKKLNVVKKAKSLLGLSLKEAKELVDSAPSILKEGIPKDEAEGLKKQFEEEGAEIELK